MQRYSKYRWSMTHIIIHLSKQKMEFVQSVLNNVLSYIALPEVLGAGGFWTFIFEIWETIFFLIIFIPAINMIYIIWSIILYVYRSLQYNFTEQLGLIFGRLYIMKYMYSINIFDHTTFHKCITYPCKAPLGPAVIPGDFWQRKYSLLRISSHPIHVNIIQIWTCDEGNIEFCGSEATILTEAKPRSILLPKIHKTHIAQIIGQYLLYYLSNVYGSSILVYGYIYC